MVAESWQRLMKIRPGRRERPLLVFLVILFLVTPLAGLAGASAVGRAGFEFATTSVLYRPGEPFRITDTRYPDKTNVEARKLDVYQPYEDGRPLHDRPVIFFVHGGGWIDGYAEAYTQYLTPILVGEQGWVVVNVDYRLTSDRVFLAESYPRAPVKAAWYDDNLRDVADAFEWTVDNVAAYGGDPQNIFLFGHSAGGHLVSLLATHDAHRALRSRIRAVITMSGVYYLNDLPEEAYGPVLDQTFRGGRFDVAALAEASPATYLGAGEDFPPFYLLHCQIELPALSEQAVAFKTEIEMLGLDVREDYLLGYTHESEMTAIADGGETVTQLMVDYVASRVRNTIYLPVALAAP